MSEQLHPLFVRLLRRCGLDGAAIEADPRWSELSKRISRTLVENDEDRYLRERSMDISSREMQALNAALAEERKRLQSELLVAQNLQTSILPRDLTKPTFEVAARMVPATEVGGDYYDVIPAAGACWIGIGDVAGHGLRAAVIMTMVQSMTAAIVRHVPSIAPREVMTTLNQCVRENVFTRMHFDNHVTMTLFRCGDDGTITHAGAHETILVVRKDGAVEEIDTTGVWLGPMADIAAMTIDETFRLEPGDLFVVHTDGVVEARKNKEEFGFKRLKETVVAHRNESVATICDKVLEAVHAHSRAAEDDITLLAFRRAS